MVALDRQQRNIRKPYAIHAHVHLIEQNADTCAYLRKVIAETPDASASNTAISIYQGDFNQKLPDILTDIQSRQKKNGRSVFILDQYGWSQVNLEAVKRIFSELPSAEVFLTWMVDKLNPALQRAGLGSILTAEQLLAIKNGESGADGDLTWRRAIQSIMTEQIRSISGATYCTLFYIVPRSSRRGYWLLHLAQHLRANEEMKRIHWENNNLHHPGGSGFNMLGFIGNNGQLAFDNRFDGHANQVTLEALRNDIPRRVSELRTPILFGELVQLTANETPARPQQLQEAVFSLAQERELILRTRAESTRRTAHSLAADDTIELPTQLWLLPNSAG